MHSGNPDGSACRDDVRVLAPVYFALHDKPIARCNADDRWKGRGAGVSFVLVQNASHTYRLAERDATLAKENSARAPDGSVAIADYCVRLCREHS
jgi:hypothetical protein